MNDEQIISKQGRSVLDFNHKGKKVEEKQEKQEEYFLAEHNFLRGFFWSGKVPGRSIIFRLVGRTNVTPQARGINQTGLHKFQTEEKQTRENLSGEKTIWKKYFQKKFGKNISYLMFHVRVCCCWGGGGP